MTERRLTDAELGAIDERHWDLPRESDGCCLIHLAIAELRELREDNADIRAKNVQLVTENMHLKSLRVAPLEAENAEFRKTLRQLRYLTRKDSSAALLLEKALDTPTTGGGA